MLLVARRNAGLEPNGYVCAGAGSSRNYERRISRSDHPLGPRPASPFACLSTPKGEVAETGAAVGGVIVEAGGG